MKNANKKESRGIASYLTTVMIFYLAIILFPLLASAQEPVYYNGAIYPTGYPYSHTGSQFGTDGNYLSYLTQSLSASCTASPLSARAGETVLWFSSVTGGAGNYQYFWSGSDGMTGNNSSVRRSYDTTGNKYATVTVTSDGQSVTTGCIGALSIQPTPPTEPVQPGFGASCYATPEKIAPEETVSWLAIVSGTLGTTTYSWSGTENLIGNQPIVEKTYSSIGAKQAILAISSNGKTVITPCANKVTVAPLSAVPAQAEKTPALLVEQPKPATSRTATTQVSLPAPSSARQAGAAPLQGICAPSTTTADIDEPVLWQATAIGGSGSYSFNWQGDEELSGQDATTSKTYKTAGEKNASVTISSLNKKITVTCAPDIEISPEAKQTGLLAASVFSNWTVSFFFVLTLVLAVALFFSFMLRRRKETSVNSEQMPPIPHLPIQQIPEEPMYYPIPEEEKED